MVAQEEEADEGGDMVGVAEEKGTPVFESLEEKGAPAFESFGHTAVE